jgi:transcriptional regulator of acetoin/glycerol metabolism
MNASLQSPAQRRLAEIERVRRAVLSEGRGADPLPVGDGLDNRGWIERSWRRCLENGQLPEQRLTFERVGEQARRSAVDSNQALLQAARPMLDQLGRAIANSHYIAILTDARGIVIDADGPIASVDSRARLLTRVGVDLSERAVGTTAIGAALAELAPVWLHRGEHFFRDTTIFSCAGAPLFDPDGQCAGMLDLTGVEAPERPELKHLVAQWARRIENAMTLGRPHALLLRLNWPGCGLGGDSDGLLGLDAEGAVTTANGAARQMLAQLAPGHAATHCSELFAAPWERLFDAARDEAPIDVPLWSGLVLQVLAQRSGEPARPATFEPRMPLREIEAALIRKVVTDVHGNVKEAAQRLGISRATVYRKLGRK